jgi:2-polyprenyl-6-methoxyphenol hydroxylase-like FAD-dependent oxidoreductase
MLLASFGVETVVVEQRAAHEPPDARCNHISARTMEVFRKLGVADAVRNTGLPPDYPHDVVYATRFAGYELGRVHIPSRAERFTDLDCADANWPTAEPPHRINQHYMEPVLFRHAQHYEKLRILNRTVAEQLTQDDEEVTLTARELDSGRIIAIKARYAAGCDGARSRIRHALGVSLQGDDGLMHAMMATITAPDLLSRSSIPRAWMYWIVNPLQPGVVVAQDGTNEWVVNAFYRTKPEEQSYDWDTTIRMLLGTDAPFTISSTKYWAGRRLLAERFRSGRVFLLGDAAHNWLPMAGYGMNAGIADADNLAWKLAAVINGWGAPEILDSFEKERRPILDQVSRFVARVRKGNDFDPPAELEEDSAAGRAAREKIGAYMLANDAPQFACIGLNFGYFYDNSPIIAYDGASAPEYGLAEYTPSSVPGCRAPHLWLEDRRVTLYDRITRNYALIRRDPSIDTAPLQREAAAKGVPLEVIDIDHAQGHELYDKPLTLVRPDQHVAWRGETPGEAGIIERIRGAT